MFSNEFFDALPVHRVVWIDGEPRESLVGWRDGRFVWVDWRSGLAVRSASTSALLPDLRRIDRARK